jgi:hypothetical protein
MKEEIALDASGQGFIEDLSTLMAKLLEGSHSPSEILGLLSASESASLIILALMFASFGSFIWALTRIDMGSRVSSQAAPLANEKLLFTTAYKQLSDYPEDLSYPGEISRSLLDSEKEEMIELSLEEEEQEELDFRNKLSAIGGR